MLSTDNLHGHHRSPLMGDNELTGYLAWIRPRSLVCLIFLLLITGLTGCANQPQQILKPPLKQLPPSSPLTSETRYRTIPADSLFALLAAELAGKRQQYDVSLGYYLEQAEATQDPDIARRAARIAQFLGQPETAITALDIWRADDPGNVEALKIAAQVAINQGQWLESIALLAELKQLGGDAPFDFVAAQMKQLPTDQLLAVKQKLTDLSQRYPKDPRLLYSLAIISQQQKEYEITLSQLNRVVKVDPNFVNAVIQKARVLLLMDETVEATNWLAKNQQRFTDNQVLLLMLARLYLDQEDYPKARPLFKTLTELKSDNATELLSLALIDQQLKNYQSAEQILLGLQAYPQLFSVANFYLGELAEQQQDFDRALNFYRSIAPSREFPMAVLYAARIIKKQVSLDAAREFIEERRVQFPESQLDLLKIEVRLLIEVDRYNQAIDQLNIGLDQFPDQPELLYSRAMVAEQLNDLGALEVDLRRLLELQPENVEALNALGYTLANKTERFDDAFILIEQALSLSPDNPAIIDSMGWLYFRQGLYDQAEPLLRRAFELLNDHEIAAHYGELLWTLGQQTAAQKVWSKGLEKTPDSVLIDETRRRLGAQ